MDRVFSLLLWPKREARGPWKQGRKKRGSITCCTDRANEANKMFIIWLCRLFRVWKGDRELAVRTATYWPGIDQSQHAKSVSHIINSFKFFYCTYDLVKIQHIFQGNVNWHTSIPSSIVSYSTLSKIMHLGETADCHKLSVHRIVMTSQ